LEEPAAELETHIDPHQEVIRLRHAVAEAPQDDNLKLELALALSNTGAGKEALALFDALPANLALDERVRKARARLDLAERVINAPAIAVLQAAIAANPNDAEALKLLGLRCIAGGDAEAGLQHLLRLFRDHRQFQEGIARTLLIEAFDMLDDEDLVRSYRRKMASLLN
jgi:putative thioredoxin